MLIGTIFMTICAVLMGVGICAGIIAAESLLVSIILFILWTAMVVDIVCMWWLLKD